MYTNAVDVEDISVQHDTYAYWTHIEEYPMHLREQRRRVLSEATACFWSAITFLSNGTSALYAGNSSSFLMNHYIS